MNVLCLVAALGVLPLRAEPAPDKVSELERKLDALAQDVETLKLGSGGPLRRLSLGGYGEITAAVPATRDQKGTPSGKLARADLQRFVLLGDYDFSDRIVLKFEVEFEHGGSGQGAETRGEAGVEQAYIDFRVWKPLNFRAGHVLVPMGLVNLVHEPPFFHGVRRPSVETFVIPSTWHENGLGAFGTAGALSYETYLVAGLNAVKATAPAVDGFTGSNGLAGSSSEGSQSPAASRAWASRIDLKPAPGALAGASLYIGGAAQNATASVPLALWDLHASLDRAGVELRALYAEGTIGDADAVNIGQLKADPTFADFVGRRLFGGYLQGAFNTLSLFPSTAQYLAPFFRYERYDTDSRVPRGFVNNAAASRVEYTAGLTYKPIPQVALKADYQWLKNQARSGIDQWNLGLGWAF